MRGYLIFTLVTSILFAVGISTVIAVDRSREPLPPAIALDPNYEPGMLVPPDSLCSWQYSTTTEDYCNNKATGHDYISFSYDMQTRRITIATMSGNGISVGTLITMWGTPTGYTEHGNWRTLFWGDRAALVFTSPFDPSNPAVYLIYGWMPDNMQPWRGFVTRRDAR